MADNRCLCCGLLTLSEWWLLLCSLEHYHFDLEWKTPTLCVKVPVHILHRGAAGKFHPFEYPLPCGSRCGWSGFFPWGLHNHCACRVLMPAQRQFDDFHTGSFGHLWTKCSGIVCSTMSCRNKLFFGDAHSHCGTKRFLLYVHMLIVDTVLVWGFICHIRNKKMAYASAKANIRLIH